MMQGFNTGNAWSTYTSAAGKGQKLFAEGLESLGKAYAERVKDAEKKRIQGIKEADKFETDQAKGAYIYALQQGDKAVANNILSQRPDLMAFAGEANEFYDPGKEQLRKARGAYIAAFKSDNKEAQTEILKSNPGLVADGFVKSVQEANSFGQPEEMTPYQTAYISYLNNNLASGGDNYNANIAWAEYVKNLPEKERKELIESGVLKPQQSNQSKIDLEGEKAALITAAQKEREKNKKEAALDYDPRIKEKTKEAELFAIEFNNSKNELQGLKANMPQLTKVVNKLKRLAKTATYTTTGVIKNTASRELGMDVPQAAVDRAEYKAIVSNQVLPLLKQTFGAAFTAAEGEALKATLGDPNSSPEEKNAELNSFIDQKKQQLLTTGNTFKTLARERAIRDKQQGSSGSRQPTNQREQPETTDKTPRQQALDWIEQNPDDPRVQAVRAKLGI